MCASNYTREHIIPQKKETGAQVKTQKVDDDIKRELVLEGNQDSEHCLGIKLHVKTLIEKIESQSSSY